MVPREHFRWEVHHGGYDVRGFRSLLALAATLSMVLIGTGTVSASPLSASTTSTSKPYTCTSHHGGIVPPGTYSSLLISGVCYAPAGTVIVKGNLTVAPGALLDAAATLGDPLASPLLLATVIVGGNVTVGRGAVLVLGCSPAGGCTGVTYDHIGGNLTAIKAQAVLVQAVAIGGSVTVLGGGGSVLGGPPKSGACFAAPIPAPWSQDPATFAANATSDPDGMELGSNLVGGNLACFSNVPAAQFGDSSAAPNMVRGAALGECGFNVVLPNPPGGHGVREHISVRTSSLGTYSGRHIQTANGESISLGTTVSGDQLAAALNNDLLRGAGLHGSITVVPGSPPGSSGEAVLATVHPDGSQSFEAFKSACATSTAGAAW